DVGAAYAIVVDAKASRWPRDRTGCSCRPRSLRPALGCNSYRRLRAWGAVADQARLKVLYIEGALLREPDAAGRASRGGSADHSTITRSEPPRPKVSGMYISSA